MTYQIYEWLRQGKTSGGEMGRRLNISRAAVNKHIRKLRECEIVIESASGIGYRWIKDNAVNEYGVRYHLRQLKREINVVFKPTESTNTNAKALSMDNSEDLLVVAPYQTEGRGRLDRKFISNKGGAYFSLVINDSGLPVATVMRTVLVAGLAVRDALMDYGIESELKWPNDVMISGRKVSGILLELIASGETADKIIMGIGINVNNQLPDELGEVATRLADYKQIIDISELIAKVISKIYFYFHKLRSGHWIEIKDKYLKYSYNLNKTVVSGGIKGVAKGITDEGFLIVDSNGKENKIITGDVNLC